MNLRTLTSWLSCRVGSRDEQDPARPPLLARAAEALRSHPPARLTQDEVDRAVDSIRAPYPQRTIRTFRAALRSSEDPPAQAEAVYEVVRRLGLEPFTPPSPLPEITPEDVHLVCWLALTP